VDNGSPVFNLDIPMNKTMLMHVLQSKHYFCEERFGFALLEPGIGCFDALNEVEEEVTTAA
jgi:hypothetical protein